MAKVRLNQFAEDLGVSRSAAQKLMNKARGRKDGGSEILEKNMGSVVKPQTAEEDAETKERMRKKFDRSKKLREQQAKEMEEGVKAKDGKYMTCGGMRKAVGGGKFTGVY